MTTKETHLPANDNYDRKLLTWTNRMEGCWGVIFISLTAVLLASKDFQALALPAFLGLALTLKLVDRQRQKILRRLENCQKP